MFSLRNMVNEHHWKRVGNISKRLIVRIVRRRLLEQGAEPLEKTGAAVEGRGNTAAPCPFADETTKGTHDTRVKQGRSVP